MPELALTVICAEREIDAEAGAEECVRLSLLNSEVAPDESHFFWAPELARLFGRKKLESDPDRLAIQEALLSLRRFTALKPGQVAITSQSDVVRRFLNTSLEHAKEWTLMKFNARIGPREDSRIVSTRMAAGRRV